tara:strand:- start:241 stop:504 length:264 start_codon:yes stop_codon:yes gene_type:complete
MVRKILDGIAVLSLLLSAGTIASGTYAYLWIINEDNQNMIKEKVMKQVMSSISIPSLSGPALPTNPLSQKQQKNEEKKAIGIPFSPF